MKKYIPYIIGFVALLIIALILINSKRLTPKVFDERITLNRRDKIPYGTSAASSLLHTVFPQAAVYYDSKSPGNWDSLLPTSYNQAVILMARNFNADEDELNRLIYFAQQGNYVIIIARSFSYNTVRYFNFSYKEDLLADYVNSPDDSLSLRLKKPSFTIDSLFYYPGKKYESEFYTLDTSRTAILGQNKNGKADFVEYKTGNGAIFIHTSPLAFSNYFLLHKNNYQYFEKALSVIPDKVDKILWNEYYLIKPISSDEREPSWLRVLWKYPAFKWSFVFAFIILALYLLLGIRRDQRMIPAWDKPVNESLDFVKTLGRLYYDRHDHIDLARKMSNYFLDHVRANYKIPTNALDDKFIETLHYKSGYAIEDLNKIIEFIKSLDEKTFLSEEQLSLFYKQLELFYQNT